MDTGQKVGIIISAASGALGLIGLVRAAQGEEPFLNLGGPYSVHLDASGHATLVLTYDTNAVGEKHWTVVPPQPGPVTFQDTGNIEVTMVFAAVGQYNIELEIDIGNGVDSIVGSVQIAVDAPIASVELTPESSTVPAGQTLQLTATCRYSDGSSANCSANPLTQWSSSNPEAATISATGLLIAVAPGSAIITVQHLGKSDTSTFAVSTGLVAPVLTLGANPTARIVIVGGIATAELTYTATGNPAPTVSWAGPPQVTISEIAPGVLRLTSAVAGVYSVVVSATNSVGVATKTAIFTVLAPATLNLGDDITREFVNGEGTIQDTYSWSPPEEAIATRNWTVIQGNPDNLHIIESVGGVEGRVDFHIHAPGVYELELAIVLVGGP